VILAASFGDIHRNPSRLITVRRQFVPSRLRPERTAQHQSRSPHPRRQIDCRRKTASRREAKLSRPKIRSQLNSPASISLRWRATSGAATPAAWRYSPQSAAPHHHRQSDYGNVKRAPGASGSASHLTVQGRGMARNGPAALGGFLVFQVSIALLACRRRAAHGAQRLPHADPRRLPGIRL
jgi:hypothetical protein